MSTIKIKPGGVPKEAFDKDGIVPVIFAREPFSDASFQLNNLDKMIRNNEVSDFIIMIKKREGGCKYIWRGEHPLTILLGMIELVKMMIFENVFLSNE